MGYLISVPIDVPLKKIGKNYRKIIKEQDLQLKRKGTMANQCTKNYEFRRMKANFVEENFVDFCFLEYIVFPNVGFLSTFEIIKDFQQISFKIFGLSLKDQECNFMNET